MFKTLSCISCNVGDQNCCSSCLVVVVVVVVIGGGVILQCLACSHGRYGNNCSYECSCLGNGCDPEFGKCFCAPGKTGPKCNLGELFP